MRVVLPVLVLAVVSLGVVDALRDSTAPPRRDLLGKQFDAKIVRVADGDTLEATAAGERGVLRIRLQGVDAPEQGEAFGAEAVGLLRKLVGGQPVRVSVRDIDRYGRLVARITAGGTDASVALVRAGLACHAYAADAALAREESQARAAGVGFWAATAKKPACVAQTSLGAVRVPRANAPVTGGPPVSLPPRPPVASAPPAAAKLQYRGNTSSLVYHASTCPNATCRNCTRVFASEADAKLAGFRPAGDCARQ